jgi:hypothetical protein
MQSSMTRRPTEYNTSPGRKPSPGMQSIAITDQHASSRSPPIAAETELHLASVISPTMPADPGRFKGPARQLRKRHAGNRQLLDNVPMEQRKK